MYDYKSFNKRFLRDVLKSAKTQDLLLEVAEEIAEKAEASSGNSYKAVPSKNRRRRSVAVVPIGSTAIEEENDRNHLIRAMG